MNAVMSDSCQALFEVPISEESVTWLARDAGMTPGLEPRSSQELSRPQHIQTITASKTVGFVGATQVLEAQLYTV